MPKITENEYAGFLEHYTWEKLKNPDYRIGQAFLNYFPDVGKFYNSQGGEGQDEEYRLWNERSVSQAQKIIDRWRDRD